MQKQKRKFIYTLVILLTSVSFVGFSMDVNAQFAQVKPWVPPKREIKIPEDYKQYLLQAMQLHFLQKEIGIVQTTLQPMSQMYKQKADLAKDQMDALTSCNVKKLSDIYKNPENAWKKMTETYDARERDLTLYVNASTPAPQSDEWENAHPYWRVGRDLLMDVYANPSEFGELKSPEAGFKPWKDQDYVYVEQVNDFLTTVTRLLGVPSVPGVSRTNDITQNTAAYKTFLNQMKTQNPNGFAKLTPEMLSFPKPPKPLPPANELIKLTQESSQGQLFPSMPEPWAYYAKNPQVQRLPNGEMNEYYKPNSLQLRSEVGDKMLENRFAAYQERRSSLAAADEAFKTVQNGLNDRQQSLMTKMKDLGLNIEVNMDDLDAVKAKIGEHKKVAIDKARTLLSELSEYSINKTSEKMDKFVALEMGDKLQALDEFDRESAEYDMAMRMINADQRQMDADYLDAMEKDINGLTALTEENARDVEEMMKGEIAQQALQQAVYDDSSNNIAKERAKKIDVDCLNGGI